MKLLKELEEKKKNKILGLLLCTLALLLFVSLISYDKADYPEFAELHNRGGIAGAYIAHWFYLAFGFCSIFIPIGLAAWGGNRFTGRSIERMTLATLVGAFFLVSLMTLISLFHATRDFSTLGLTFGGALGHYAAKGLVRLVGGLVAFTFVISLIITGLMLVVPKVASEIARKVWGFISHLLLTSFLPKRAKEKPKTKTKVVAEPASVEAKKDGFLAGIIHIKKKAPPIPESEKPEIVLETPRPAETGETVFERPVVQVAPVNRIKGIRNPGVKGEYRLPSIDLLDDPPSGGPVVDDSYYKKTAEALRHTLLTFGVEIESGEVNIFPGPIITRFEFKPASGIKVLADSQPLR